MFIKELGLEVPSFTENDIDLSKAEKKSKIESNKIFNNNSTRRGRTFGQIYRVNLQSQIAECYCIEKLGFKDDKRPYMDVIKNGISVDVKTSTSGILTRKNDIIEEMSDRRNKGMMVADYILGFDIVGGIYIPRLFAAVGGKVKSRYPIITKTHKASCITPIRTSPERLYNSMVGIHGEKKAKKILSEYGYTVK